MKNSYTARQANDLLLTYRTEPMTYVHSDFRTREILDFIDDHILSYNVKSASDLSQEDKNELTAMLITASGRTDEFCCLTDNKDSDVIINIFKKALTKNTIETDLEVMEEIKKIASKYFEDTMDSLIDERASELRYDSMIEAGCSPRYHQDNGELYWVKG